MKHGSIVALNHDPTVKYMAVYPDQVRGLWCGEFISMKEPHIVFCFYNLHESTFTVQPYRTDEGYEHELYEKSEYADQYNMFGTNGRRNRYNLIRQVKKDAGITHS